MIFATGVHDKGEMLWRHGRMARMPAIVNLSRPDVERLGRTAGSSLIYKPPIGIVIQRCAIQIEVEFIGRAGVIVAIHPDSSRAQEGHWHVGSSIAVCDVESVSRARMGDFKYG